MAAQLDKPYCTLNQVQKETSNNKTQYEDWLRECINNASRFIDECCHRDFWYHDHTSEPYEVPLEFVLDDEIYLPFNTITLTGVSFDPDGVDDLEALASGDYRVINRSARSRIFKQEGSFGPHPFRGRVQLTGTFGLEVVDTETPPEKLPFSVSRAACLIAAAISSEKRLEQVGLDGNRVEVLSTMIPKEAKYLLKKHIVRFVEG